MRLVSLQIVALGRVLDLNIGVCIESSRAVVNNDVHAMTQPNGNLKNCTVKLPLPL